MNSWKEVMTTKTNWSEPQFSKGFGMWHRPQRNSYDEPLACLIAIYCPLYIFMTLGKTFGVYTCTPKHQWLRTVSN